MLHIFSLRLDNYIFVSCLTQEIKSVCSETIDYCLLRVIVGL